MAVYNRTRVSAPAISNSRSDRSATLPCIVPMTSGSQSPRDGATLIVPSGRIDPSMKIDLRQKIRLATWNVMTLMGQHGLTDPDSYPIALTRELARFKITCAGITEARIPGAGCLRIEGSLILHSGGTHQLNGVALVICPSLSQSLVSWRAVSDRLLLARFSHRHGHLSIIVAYAPTEPSDDSIKTDFYNQLSALTQAVPPHDILAVLGDLNASSGTCYTEPGVIGPFGSGMVNNNSDRLRTYCNLHGMSILGSWFRRPDIHRWTWLSHDGITKKEIDHILVRQRDRGMFLTCRAFRSAEAPANTDHVLLVATMRLALLRKKKKNLAQSTHFHIHRLTCEPALQQQYNITVTNKFDQLAELPEDVEECWSRVRSVIHDSASTVLGSSRNPRKPWLSTDAMEVIEMKASAKLRGDRVERKRLQGVFKAIAKADHETYINRIADQVESDLLHNKLGSAFKAIKQLSGSTSSTPPSNILKSDGSPCESEEEALLRWSEHFSNALNHPPGAPSDVLDDEAFTANVDSETFEDEPTIDEVKAAIKRLRNGRAPGPDGVSSELLKYALTPIANALHFLFIRVWRTGKIPAEWRDGIIVTLYKGKGSRRECGNYRPITLLSIPGKVFAHVLLGRIQPLLDMTRRPQQSGFTSGRSTIDAILALRLLSEIHREFNRPLSVAYLDIKAAFDSVDRNALWKALRGCGVPDMLLNLIIALHEGTRASVRLGNKLSPSLQTTSGVRQGCVLAPALFCVAIDWIMNHMTTKPNINVGGQNFSDLGYADDTSLLVQSDRDAEQCLSSFSESAKVLGLNTSWPKTKVQDLGAYEQIHSLQIEGHSIDKVERFTYLGSILSSDGYSRADLDRRIGLASSAMSSLHRIWQDRHLSLLTKCRVYQTLVMPVLLYASETWTLLAADIKHLEAFHMSCQRLILRVRWYDFIRNSDIVARTGLPTISDCITKRRNAIFGHVARMAEDTPAHQALRCHVDLTLGRPPDNTWRRPTGRPRSRWIDQLRRDNNIPPADLWRRAVGRGHSGVTLRSMTTMR